MRMFRFICWFRGWHYGWAVVTDYAKEAKAVTVTGPIGCRVCAQIAPQGQVKDSWIGLSWQE